MLSIAVLVGGALVFSGSNRLFCMLKSSDEERKHHDKAGEQLQAAQAEWSRKWTEHLDWISEDLRRQRHAVQTFWDVDDAIREYWRVTRKQFDPFGPEHKLSDLHVVDSRDRQYGLKSRFVIKKK